MGLDKEPQSWFDGRQNMFKIPETQSLSEEQKRLAFVSWLKEHSVEEYFVSVHAGCHSCPYRRT